MRPRQRGYRLQFETILCRSEDRQRRGGVCGEPPDPLAGRGAGEIP